MALRDDLGNGRSLSEHVSYLRGMLVVVWRGWIGQIMRIRLDEV
jgi:hypothetical protein